MIASPGKFATSRPSIVLCGDSLLEQSTVSKGLATLLADKYRRKADVIVRGYSGYNTNHYIDLVKRHQANRAWNFQGLMFLWLGANDAAEPAPVKPDQHVPVDQYGSNLGTIIDLISEGSKNPVVLMTPPPVDDLAYDRHCKSIPKPTLRRLEITRMYADAVLQVGKDKNIPVIDVFNEMLSFDNWREFLSDGLHLTELGYRKVFELIMATIRTRLPDYDADRLLLDAPIWQQAECWENAHPNYT